MTTKEDLDMNISLKFGRDQLETTIKKKNCDEAVKDLGLLVSPEGDFSLDIRYCGFQLAHLFLKQGYLSIKHFIGRAHKETLTGNQIVSALSKTQLISGSGHLPLEEVGSDKSYVPANWLSNIRTFLRCCKVSIIVSGAWLLTTQQ
eukprot:10473398-Ditylum_brightwellii.AAC.1